MTRKILTFLLFFVFASNVSFSQQVVKAKSSGSSSLPGKESPVNLYNEIFQADSLMFNALNTCDSVTYKKFIAEDLEFYHDLGGFTVGAENEMKSFRETCARGNKIRRELVKGTLEVYPVKGYGAMEIGEHRFYHTNKGEQEKLSGTYKFVQIWQLKDGQWKITRVISYGHNHVNNN